jgi:hypothetical protein
MLTGKITTDARVRDNGRPRFLTIGCSITIAFLLFSSSPASAQSFDKFITKKFADYLFGLKKSQWDTEARKVFQPEWRLKMIPQDTGGVFYASDPSGGPVIELIPFFWDANFPTSFVMVTFYYPLGERPPTDRDAEKELEVSIRQRLGPQYSIEPVYTQNETMEIIQFTINTAKK